LWDGNFARIPVDHFPVEIIFPERADYDFVLD
jgi:hypothetical protein